MLALIRKDLLVMAGSFRFMLATILFLVVFFWFTGSATVIAMVPMMMSMLLSLALFTQDAQSHWARLAAMLPTSNGRLVVARYMVMFGIWIVSLLVSLAILGGSVASGMAQVESFSLHLWQLMGFGLLLLLALACIIPLVYRFGVEKARIALFAVLVLPSAAASAIARSGKAVADFSAALDLPLLVGIGILAAVVLVPASCAVSMAVVRHVDPFKD